MAALAETPAPPSANADTKGRLRNASKKDAKVDAKVGAGARGDAKAETKGDAKAEARGETKGNTKADAKAETKVEAKVDAKPEGKPAGHPKAEQAHASRPELDLRIVDTKPEREVERVERAAKPERRRGQFQSPSTELLDAPPTSIVEVDRESIYENARRLEKTLADYDVMAKVEEVRPGPTVTMYEVSCQAGTRVSKVASLADDLALGLSRKVRIVAPIPARA